MEQIENDFQWECKQGMNEIGIWERLIPRPSEGGLCCFPQKIDFGTVPVHSIFYTTIVIAMRRGTNENDHITIVPGSHRLVTLGKPYLDKLILLRVYLEARKQNKISSALYLHSKKLTILVPILGDLYKLFEHKQCIVENLSQAKSSKTSHSSHFSPIQKLPKFSSRDIINVQFDLSQSISLIPPPEGFYMRDSYRTKIIERQKEQNKDKEKLDKRIEQILTEMNIEIKDNPFKENQEIKKTLEKDSLDLINIKNLRIERIYLDDQQQELLTDIKPKEEDETQSEILIQKEQNFNSNEENDIILDKADMKLSLIEDQLDIVQNSETDRYYMARRSEKFLKGTLLQNEKNTTDFEQLNEVDDEHINSTDDKQLLINKYVANFRKRQSSRNQQTGKIHPQNSKETNFGKIYASIHRSITPQNYLRNINRNQILSTHQSPLTYQNQKSLQSSSSFNRSTFASQTDSGKAVNISQMYLMERESFNKNENERFLIIEKEKQRKQQELEITMNYLFENKLAIEIEQQQKKEIEIFHVAPPIQYNMISRDKWDKLKGIKWYNKLKEYLSSEENGGGCLSRNDEDEQGFEKDNQMQQGECPKKYLVYIPPPIPEPDFNSEDEGDDYSEISSIPSLNSIEFE